MLLCEELQTSDDLVAVIDGRRVIEPGEESEAVGMIQAGLIDLGFELPEQGSDDVFSDETSAAIEAFKQDRELSSEGPIIDSDTLARLDLEWAFLQDAAPAGQLDLKVAMNDVFAADILRLQNVSNIVDSVIDAFELGDKLCLRMGFILAQEFVPGVESLAKQVGRFVEPFIVKDYIAQKLFSNFDFFDLKTDSADYEPFLARMNPSIDTDSIHIIARRKRPDILRHRDPLEWYEIKPESLSGFRAGRKKNNEIDRTFSEFGLPYSRGTDYTPTPEIVIREYVVDGTGEQFTLFLDVRRSQAGLLLYTLCVRSDGIRFLRRVGVVVGTLAILQELGLLGAAGAAGTVVETVQAIMALFEIEALPVLQAVK